MTIRDVLSGQGPRSERSAIEIKDPKIRKCVYNKCGNVGLSLSEEISVIVDEL